MTIDDVADLGPDLLQYSAVTSTSRRWWGPPVNVQAGATVVAPRLVLGDGLMEFGADWPTWHSDGSRLGYVVGLGTLYQIEANPGLLELGEPLLNGQSSALFVDNLAWSPVAATANQLLYAGSGFAQDLSEVGVFRIYEGNPGPGEVLVSPSEVWHTVTGLAWLPDGSGFIFAMSEDTFIGEKADIYQIPTHARRPGEVDGRQLSGYGRVYFRLMRSRHSRRLAGKLLSSATCEECLRQLIFEFQESRYEAESYASEISPFVRHDLHYRMGAGTYYPTRELEEGGAHDCVDEYDNDTFWAELVDRLVRRDLIQQEGGLEKVMQMSQEERIRKMIRLEEQYQAPASLSMF
jgi:hypothetical protein